MCYETNILTQIFTACLLENFDKGENNSMHNAHKPESLHLLWNDNVHGRKNLEKNWRTGVTQSEVHYHSNMTTESIQQNQ